MSEFIRHLFTSDFMPHGHCCFWSPLIRILTGQFHGSIAIGREDCAAFTLTATGLRTKERNEHHAS